MTNDTPSPSTHTAVLSLATMISERSDFNLRCKDLWSDAAKEMAKHILATTTAPQTNVPLQTVSESDLQEALKLLPSVMRPSMSRVIISALNEQAAIIASMKSTSHARQLAFEAAMSDAAPPQTREVGK